MAITPNLLIPYLEAAQSQKHVTHNEALTRLDALVQIAVADRDVAAPPVSPADGERYIVATGASGAWTGHASKIAAYQDGAWELYSPREGWLAWVADEDVLLAWNGGTWIAAASGGGGGGGGSVNPAPLVGVNATADTTNRLSVASPAALFSHEGSGHQLKINKAAAANTASLVFQTGFSGRAEMGLAGDDDWRIKVSPNGTTWTEAIVIDRTSGAVTFPNTSFGGAADHGTLTGLGDDDHPQYHTDARGDARYYTKAQSDSSLAAKAEKTQTDFISGLIKTLGNQDYRLVVNIPYGGTVTRATTRSASGTCTATFKINASALGGAANAVSTSEQEQAHASSNAFVAGDDIVVTVSANAACTDMSFTLEFTRTLG